MLLLRGLELVTRPGILAISNFYKKDMSPLGSSCGSQGLLQVTGGAVLLALPFLLWLCGTSRGREVLVFTVLAVTRMASRRLQVSLFLSGKRCGKSHFGGNLFVAFSGICRFCWARRSLLPMSIETMQALKEALLIAFMMSLHAILCRSVIMLEMVES